MSERNKVFVYQEDFGKFVSGLKEVLEYVQGLGCSVGEDLTGE